MPLQKCTCLPGKDKRAIQFALEEKAYDYEQLEKQTRAQVEKYPGMAEAIDDTIRANPQYQQGLVNASDLVKEHVMTRIGEQNGPLLLVSKIMADEYKERGAYYRRLSRDVRDTPDC